MTYKHAHWWTRAAQNLSRRGLLWLALTAIALSSLANSSAGATAGARMVAALSAAATGKLKASTPGTPNLAPREANRSLPQQVHGPDGDAKRGQPSAAPVGLVLESVSAAIAPRIETTSRTVLAVPAVRPRGVQARAPPRLA
jgi:hypothetical protein